MQRAIRTAVATLGALLLLAAADAPAASRSGGVLVFTSDRDGTGTHSIYTVRPDGTHMTRLFTGGAEARISPDGTRVVLSPSPSDALFVVDVSTGKRLSVLNGFIFGWAWSGRTWAPDSSRFIAASEDGLWTIDADGGDRRQITYSTDDGEQAWSPDGRSIAFNGSGNALYVVGADGTGLRRVTDGEGGYPDWSPDGSRIAFVRSQDDGTYVTFVVPASGGTATRVGPGWASWSPDGRVLAVADEEAGLALYTPGGARQRVLLAGQGADSPLWSPDGRSVLAVVDGDLRLFPRDGGKSTQVTRGARYGYVAFDPGWSRTAPAAIGGTPVPAAVPFTGPLIGIDRTSGRAVELPQVSARPARAAPYPMRPGTVSALASDGHGGWYVGGDFRSIGDSPCPNLAHIGADRRIDGRWCPRPDQPVHALLRLGTTLFVGLEGAARVAGATRAGLAAFDTRTGRPTVWSPRVRGEVDGLATDPSGRTLYLMGLFDRVGGLHRRNFAAVDIRTGRPTAFAPNPDTNSHGDRMTAFAVTATHVYTWGYYEHIGGKVARGDPTMLDTRSGAVLHWSTPPCDGGADAATAAGDRVFIGGGFTRLGGLHRDDLASFSGASGTVDSWAPVIGPHQFVEQLAHDGADVYVTLVDDRNGGPRRIAAYDVTTAKAVWRAHVRVTSRVEVIAAADGLVLVGGTFRNTVAG